MSFSQLLPLPPLAPPMPHVGTTLGFLGFGFQEMLLVAFVALLVFGGNLPDVMRQLGRTYGRLRASLHELSAPVREEIRQVRDVPPPRRSPTGYEAPEEVPPAGEEKESERDRSEGVPPLPSSEERVEIEEPPPV